MTLLPADRRNVIVASDCLAYVRSLPDASVNCVITSPPYWMQREYGVEGEWGSEPSIEEYIANLVELFREIRRALRDDGTVWLNLGDKYANDTKWGGRTSGKHVEALHGNGAGRDKLQTGFPPKSLLLLPHRVAIALEDDGWIVRMDVVWEKPNPLPESVKDRPTRAHEYVFMITKSPHYWYDAEPLKTPIKPTSIKRRGRAVSADHKNSDGAPGQSPHSMFAPRPNKNAQRNHGAGVPLLGRETFNERWAQKPNPHRNDGGGTEARAAFNESYEDPRHAAGANARSVWSISPEGFKGAHYATYPRELVKRCLLAGCPQKCCATCGAPYIRITEREFVPQGDVSAEKGVKGAGEQKVGQRQGEALFGWSGTPRGTTATSRLGWRPTCSCDTTETTPGVVLDPFMGSGTTALVARMAGRDYAGCDLDPRNIELAAKRIANPRRKSFMERPVDDLPLFAGEVQP